MACCPERRLLITEKRDSFVDDRQVKCFIIDYRLCRYICLTTLFFGNAGKRIPTSFRMGTYSHQVFHSRQRGRRFSGRTSKKSTSERRKSY